MDITKTEGGLESPQDLALPPEVWSMVGELIQGQDTLLALITTCRTFHDVFSPLLRRRFAFNLTAIPTSQLRRKALPTGLQYTRELEVLLEEFRGKTALLGEYDESLSDDYVSLVIRMLKEMKNLQSFRWIDSTYDDNYRPTLMLQNRELLEALKQSSTIKGVSILFASQYLDDPEDAFNCSIPLAGFKNLTSLELYNFYGNLDTLVEDIADALGECPCLKTLGLGWGCAYDCEDLPEALLIDEELTFLQKLCLDYGSRSQSSPLALDTLRLGQGMFLYDSVLPHSPQTAKYLCKLVQVDALKRLHVWNGLVKWDIDDEHESMEVDWYQLDGCKSLRQLSVSRLEEDLLDWLNTGANSVQELIITDHYGMYDDDLDNFRFLSLQNLSMLFIREMTVSKRNEDDFWSDTDSSVTDSSEAETTSGEESSSEPEARSRARTLSEAETSSQAGSISESEISSEAGTPYSELDRSIITVLDRLSDNGAQLTRLGLCIDLETQWAQFSSHLPKLRRLTQLRLDGKSHRTGQYPTKASSLWPGVETSQDIAYRYAILIHSHCPSLQYINIQQCAWQVVYKKSKSTNDDMATECVVLRPLDPDEVASIELFALKNFCSESGLPATERPGTPLTDEELNEAQRFSDEIDAAQKEGRLPPELQHIFDD